MNDEILETLTEIEEIVEKVEKDEIENYEVENCEVEKGKKIDKKASVPYSSDWMTQLTIQLMCKNNYCNDDYIENIIERQYKHDIKAYKKELIELFNLLCDDEADNDSFFYLPNDVLNCFVDFVKASIIHIKNGEHDKKHNHNNDNNNNNNNNSGSSHEGICDDEYEDEFTEV